LALYSISADDPDPARLLLGPEDIILPSWSPDGSQLAYLRTEDYQMYQNGVVKTDFYLYIAGLETLLGNQGEIYIEELVWSPNSRMIAFTGQKDATPEDRDPGKDIFQVDIYTQKITLVIKSSGYGCNSPSWNPASTEIIARCRGGNIYGVAISTKNGTNPWFEDLPCDQVAWDPTGERVMLIGDMVHLVSISGSYLIGRDWDHDKGWVDLRPELEKLGYQQKAIRAFAWAPGTNTRFLIQHDDLVQIVDLPQEKILTILGDFQDLDGQFSWGPQGEQIALVYFDGNDTEIGVVNITQESFFQLTDNQVDDLMPSWQP
jgi:Tol biopolymer transport system component